MARTSVDLPAGGLHDHVASQARELTDDSPPPLQRGDDGLYPVAMPGRYKFDLRG